MKKKALKVIALFCVVISVFFAGCNGEKTNDNDNTTATNQQNANAPAYGTKDNKAVDDDFSSDLLVDSSVKKVKYLKGIYTGDPYLPEYNTEELQAKKRQNAQRYLDELGVKDRIEFTTDLMNSVTFSLEDHKIAANERSIVVTPPSVPFDINATNEEIINFLKTDKYLSLLQTFSNVNLDNAFISVDTDGSLEELEKTDDDGYYVFRTITICNKSDSPEELAFDLSFNCIKFWIVATKDSLNSEEVSFYAKWMDDEYVVETNVTPEYFTTAKKQADNSIEAEIPNGYKTENKAKATCRIVYDDSLKENYIIPCYQFFYHTDKPDYVATVEVPCIDISALN